MWSLTPQKLNKMKKSIAVFLLFLSVGVYGQKKSTQPVYVDKAYMQDYSVKYYLKDGQVALKSAFADRNGAIKIFSSAGLMLPRRRTVERRRLGLRLLRARGSVCVAKKASGESTRAARGLRRFDLRISLWRGGARHGLPCG